MAWMLMGDFNAILHTHERTESISNSCLRGDLAFQNCVNHCSLLDIGYHGAPFTWHRGKFFIHLDRVLASLNWQVLFPKATLTHLNPMKSNHALLLLKLHPNYFDCHSRRPFHFEAAWITHKEFPDLLKCEWNMHNNWNQRLNHTKQSLLDWNRFTFGNVFYTKCRLLQRLNGITRKLL
ncbi:uncharacterized protein LOC109806346 [Cajanus cajan]|uniref:uncharacterized protein LOC109806346 n=1 Tax=Cajanus cajan TaxID=3821 RepID=UPI00098DA9DC|nr:uncharacterized protein LOC109806346 [Cajanus cajan]